VSEGIKRRASTRLVNQLRGVMLAALAAALLAVGTTGLVRPDPARAAILPTTSAAAKNPAAAAAARAARIRIRAWRFALRQRGKPYIWGGTGPYGYDCSGLVYAAYRAAGVTLPRTTYEMLDSWRLVRIPKWKARRGDLAFFGPGHVELYAWGNWTFGAATTGTLIGFHEMNSFWHPTMYFEVRP
jgi:cell wall-associated NlpC family hydrolase